MLPPRVSFSLPMTLMSKLGRKRNSGYQSLYPARCFSRRYWPIAVRLLDTQGMPPGSPELRVSPFVPTRNGRYLYIGTVDGHLIAVNMQTGKPVWDNEILSEAGGHQGFTGAPIVVKDKVIIGANGGELAGCCGLIFGVDAHTGKVAWEFDTIGGDERSRESWKNDTWKTGGGGGWMPGTYDASTDTVFWGTAPAPDYDWGGANWETDGARPGLNLYTSGVVALDPQFDMG